MNTHVKSVCPKNPTLFCSERESNFIKQKLVDPKMVSYKKKLKILFGLIKLKSGGTNAIRFEIIVFSIFASIQL